MKRILVRLAKYTVGPVILAVSATFAVVYHTRIAPCEQQAVYRSTTDRDSLATALGRARTVADSLRSAVAVATQRIAEQDAALNNLRNQLAHAHSDSMIVADIQRLENQLLANAKRVEYLRSGLANGGSALLPRNAALIADLQANSEAIHQRILRYQDALRPRGSGVSP